MKDEITMKELTAGASNETLELLLKRAKHHDKAGKHFEAFLTYAGGNNSSRVNAEDLLSLENGLIQQLKEVQGSLSERWSAESSETVREVLERQ